MSAKHKARSTAGRKKPARRADPNALDCGCPVPNGTAAWLADDSPCLCCWRCPRHAAAGHALTALNYIPRLEGKASESYVI